MGKCFLKKKLYLFIEPVVNEKEVEGLHEITNLLKIVYLPS
jgi:hypothetical protein